LLKRRSSNLVHMISS